MCVHISYIATHSIHIHNIHIQIYIYVYTHIYYTKKWFHIAYTARLPAFITSQHLVNNFPCQQLCFCNIKTDCPTPSRPTDHIPISLAKWFGALSFALAAPTPALFSSSLRLSIMPHLCCHGTGDLHLVESCLAAHSGPLNP